MPNKDYFCKYQFLKKDGETGEAGRCNLIEEKVVFCPYCVKDIFLDEESNFIISNLEKGRCNTFEISLNVEINLIKKLKKVKTKYL